jgi:glycosyltransferase involved in cell wall biosynthesis
VHAAPRSRFDRNFQNEIEQIWHDNPFDVVQSFHGNAQLANVIQWNRKRVPIVGYRAYIGHLSFAQNPSAYWSVRSPGLSSTVVVSRAVKTYLESFRLLQPKNIRVIAHGINQAWIDSQIDCPVDIRGRLGLKDNTTLVVSVASLRPYKHFELIVKAAKELKSYPIHFVHLGNPNGWDSRVREVNIHFLGHIDQLLPVLANADIVVSTSHNEAFGRSNLEAMALSKPLIGSDTGGLLDLITDGSTGKLFESLNAQSLIRSIREYYDDPQMGKIHGENAKLRVNEAFSSSVMARSYLEVYKSVC